MNRFGGCTTLPDRVVTVPFESRERSGWLGGSGVPSDLDSLV